MTLCCFKCLHDLSPKVPCVKISEVDPVKSKPNAECSITKENYQCGFFTAVPEIEVTGNNVFMCLECLERAFPGITKHLLGPEAAYAMSPITLK